MNSRFVRQTRRGVILVWALITMAVTTTVLGALGAYYVSVGRLASFYRADTESRFAGQLALDEQVSSLGAVALTSDSIAKALAGIAETPKTQTIELADKSDPSIKRQYEVEIKQVGTIRSAEELKRALDALKTGEKVEFVIEVAVQPLGGGIPVTFRQTIEIGKDYEETSSSETMPVFDYVYFANNYGRLDDAVVANGDIGANDKFTLNGACVNGYVNVRGASDADKSAIVLQNSPKIWPYYTYMSRVVSKVESDMALMIPAYATAGVEFYTPCRPTNPIYLDASQSKSIDWPGGYEPPGFNSQYGEILSSGIFSPLPTNPYASDVSKYSGANDYANLYSNYYDSNDNAITNPLQEEYDDIYDSNGDVIRPSYADTYEKYYVYDAQTSSSQPLENEYKTLYETYWNVSVTPNTMKPYEHQTEFDALKTERDTYFSSDKNYNKCSFRENPYKTEYKTYWRTTIFGEEVARSNPYRKNKNPTEWQAWEDAKNAVHTNYHNWEDGKSAWQSDGSKRSQYNSYVTASNKWSTDASSAKTKYDGWNTAKSTFDGTGNRQKYESWQQKLSEWLPTTGENKLTAYKDWNENQKQAKILYDGWNDAKQTATENFNDWQKTFEDWYNNLVAGGTELDLDWQTAHLSISNNIRQSTRIINVSTNFVEVPSLSDGVNIEKILDYCKTYKSEISGREGGWLHCMNYYHPETGADFNISITNVFAYHYEYYRTGLFASNANRLIEPIVHRGVTRHLSEVLVTKGDGTSVAPFKADAEAFSSTASLEKGSVILIGTEKYPIEIDGPVYFSGDVLIRGYVSGKGTIYAGRNVHIIGDLIYSKPPHWPHKNSDLSQAENHPEKTAERNRECDLLMLVARGNIIVGDYTSEVWQGDANMQYLKSYGETSPVCNQFSEPAIGYPQSFSRDYTGTDGGLKVETSYKTESDSGIGYGYYPFRAWQKDEITLQVTKVDRKYYESLFGEKVIAALKQTVSADPADGWQTSPTLRERVEAALNGEEVTTAQIVGSENPAAGDITEIDAALVANHGIFGVVGGDGLPQFTLNGAMICRDEGLLPSFSTRFAGRSNRKVWLNWDMRFKSDSAEGLHIGAPELRKSVSDPTFTVRVASWESR